MIPANYFNLSRFLQLLQLELFRSRKGILITLLVIFDLLLLGFVLESIFGYQKVFDSHPVAYAVALLAGGFILSSLAFQDLGNTLKRTNYLMLPASAFEKFLSLWILTCICWVIAFSALFVLFAAAANSLGHLFFSDITYVSFDLFGKTALTAIKYYVVIQGIFLAGAVHFRGYVLPKTILTLLLLGFVGGIIFYFTLSDLYPSHAEFIDQYVKMTGTPLFRLWLILKWLFWWMLAPLCWVITLIGLKEQEV